MYSFSYVVARLKALEVVSIDRVSPKGFPLKTPYHLVQLLAIRNLIANSAHSFIFILVLQLLTKALKINLEKIFNDAVKTLSCMEIARRCLNHLNRGTSHTFCRHKGAENFLCAVGNYVLISNNCTRCRGAESLKALTGWRATRADIVKKSPRLSL